MIVILMEKSALIYSKGLIICNVHEYRDHAGLTLVAPMS